MRLVEQLKCNVQADWPLGEQTTEALYAARTRTTTTTTTTTTTNNDKQQCQTTNGNDTLSVFVTKDKTSVRNALVSLLPRFSDIV
jgi:hypothetical protein